MSEPALDEKWQKLAEIGVKHKMMQPKRDFHMSCPHCSICGSMTAKALGRQHDSFETSA
ncbi:MAG: hypothetical protein ABGX10_01930 [Paracoccus sp. (in: a-proteobacteria)]|uniref:hypothetical protein n=1 Tax=Paracoccus sp. TaxID=267 RepID=UPI0032423F84